MWEIKTFKTAAARDTWIEKNARRVQFVEIFIRTRRQIAPV